MYGEGKTGVPGEKPLGARGENQQQTQPTYGVNTGIRTGPHWWEPSALTTVTLAPKLFMQTFTKLIKVTFLGNCPPTPPLSQH